MNPGRIVARAGAFVFMAIGVGALTHAQQDVPDFEGMWSDPPITAEDMFCLFFCSDVGIEYLKSLLDDPDNNERPYGELRAEAIDYQRDH